VNMLRQSDLRPRYRPTWAEVNLTALKDNVKQILSLTDPGTMLMAVVKASGYGHGALETAMACLEAGANWLGVGMLEEAIELRREGITSPILILGLIPPEAMEVAVKNDVSFTVSTAEHVKRAGLAAKSAKARAKTHLKIESGMGRIGARIGTELDEALTAYRYTPEVVLEGTFTHFACADAPEDSYTKRQFETFIDALDILSSQGLNPGIRHCANSAGIINFPSTHLDMVRPGITLYGYLPSKHCKRALRLSPCLEWKSRIVHAKEVPSGTRIGYGSTYVTQGDTVIVTIPIGYVDGYPRALSNKGEVLFRGRRVKVAGRVCMGQMMLDLGPGGKDLYKGTKVDRVGCGEDSKGDSSLEVVLLGHQRDESVTADEIADLIHGIPYEVLTGISDRVPRVIKNC
jgi:alanine racemase